MHGHIYQSNDDFFLRLFLDAYGICDGNGEEVAATTTQHKYS